MSEPLRENETLFEAELEVLWAEEVDRRLTAFERGEVKAYSREEALRLVKAALSQSEDTHLF